MSRPDILAKMREAYLGSPAVPKELIQEDIDAITVRMVEAGVDTNNPQEVKDFIYLEAMRRAYGWAPPEERLKGLGEGNGEETIQ